MRSLFFLILALPLLAAVVTQKLEKGNLSEMQSFNGSVSFNEKARLAAESAGLITKLYFDEGDYVTQGQLLLEIDSQILDANIESTKASIKEVDFALQKANLDFKRYEVLLAKQSVSQQKYDEFYFQKMQLEQRLVSLNASLRAQTIAKKKMSMRAPFNGYISQRNIQVGEWLKEGTEIALLINPDKIDVVIHLPSDYIHTVSKDAKITVMINDKAYKAKVIATLLNGDQKTRTFPVKLRLIGTKDILFDGMQARLSLEKSSLQDVFLISRDGVIKRFGKDVVFIVKENKAKMIPVEIIGYEGTMTAVSSSELTIGDDVIIKGNERIFPDQEIQK